MLLRYLMDDLSVNEVELLVAWVGDLFVILQFVQIGALIVCFAPRYRDVFYIHAISRGSALIFLFF
jgi:hypothetical protein